MTVKEYIAIIPYKDAFSSLDEEKQDATIEYAKFVLKRHFPSLDLDTVEALYPQLVGEEAVYIASSDIPFVTAYAKYDGLKKMEVKNAVAGEVWTEYFLSELSPAVRQIAGLEGLEEITDVTGGMATAFCAY